MMAQSRAGTSMLLYLFRKQSLYHCALMLWGGGGGAGSGGEVDGEERMRQLMNLAQEKDAAKAQDKKGGSDDGSGSDEGG